MADTSASNDPIVSGIFSSINTGLTGYFAEQTAKATLKAPASNAAILMGGLVVGLIVIVIAFKK